MPQGKLKTKTNQPPPKKKQGGVKNKGITKKGVFKTVPKKAVALEKLKFKKQVSQQINNKIETELKALAVRQGEGKALKILKTEEEKQAEPDDSEIGQIVIKDSEVNALELDFQHCKLKKIENLESLRKIEVLGFRWNLIKKIENLSCLASTLQELELYDNQYENKCMFDVNRLRKIEGLDKLKNLKRLYLVSNKISKIENLDELTNLEMLELGDNKIRKIENLDKLANLNEIYLGKNKITQLENLTSLTNLKILSIQANRLRHIQGLEALTNLQEFYIADNGLESLEGLEKNVELSTVEVANNSILSLKGLENLVKLEEFWANNNQLADWKEIERLSKNPALLTVYLEHNPIHKDPQYRNKLKMMLPTLQQIDATLCK